jgi:hypothetical protein
VIAVDIFRERVFLRSEEHGTRIIPLLQLKEEVERLGEVLVTAEYRARVAAEAAEAAASGGSLADGPEETNGDGPQKPDRRRRRRGRNSGGSTPTPE